MSSSSLATARMDLIQAVREADALDIHFQKFPFLKLVLRLLTDITDSGYAGPPAPPHQTPLPSRAEEGQGIREAPGAAAAEDELTGCQHQIRSLVQSVVTQTRDLNLAQLVLKVRPPAVRADLDRLVTLVAAVAKVHVASIVSASMATAVTDPERPLLPGGAALIQPRHVYDALRKLTQSRQQQSLPLNWL